LPVPMKCIQLLLIRLSCYYKAVTGIRVFFSLLSWMNCAGILAQINNDTLQPVFYVPGNIYATVYMMDTSSITGQVWKFSDSNLMMYRRSNAGIIVFKNISVTDMHSIRIQRSIFSKGLVKGAIIGSMVGYETGNSSYTTDTSFHRDALKGAAIGAVPGAIIGGMVDGVSLKKNFTINGNRRKFRKVYKILQRSQ
jgi:hypothetical protein